MEAPVLCPWTPKGVPMRAKKKQAIVKYTLRKGKSKASKMYGVSLSSVKRWCKQYNGTWHRYCLNHTDPIVILTGTQKEKKDKLEILSKSAMKDMDGMEYTVI